MTAKTRRTARCETSASLAGAVGESGSFCQGSDPVGRDVVLTGSGWSRRVHWWDCTRFGTPAFWVELTRQRPSPVTYQQGTTLLEEVAACLLGGYGITERMAAAAFIRVREAGFLTGEPVEERTITATLSTPFPVGDTGRAVRYRFPASKAKRLAAAIGMLGHVEPPSCDEPRELRGWLTMVPGVGPKTASWIVRNLTRNDLIAVIDIHIRRAGVVAGIFDPAWRLPRDYRHFEEAFVAWAGIGGVPTADLDACIWSELASLGMAARTLFGVTRLSDLD